MREPPSALIVVKIIWSSVCRPSPVEKWWVTTGNDGQYFA
jgi:hypothetical protein